MRLKRSVTDGFERTENRRKESSDNGLKVEEHIVGDSKKKKTYGGYDNELKSN